MKGESTHSAGRYVFSLLHGALELTSAKFIAASRSIALHFLLDTRQRATVSPRRLVALPSIALRFLAPLQPAMGTIRTRENSS